MAMRPAANSAPSSAAIAAASQVGAGVQSASVKARTDPAAAMIPALRAAYEPGRLSVTSVGALGWARTAAAVLSVDPLSTTSTSYGGAPRWAVKASRHPRMTRAPSRTGTTTDTTGSAAMARSVGTALSDQPSAGAPRSPGRYVDRDDRNERVSSLRRPGVVCTTGATVGT